MNNDDNTMPENETTHSLPDEFPVVFDDAPEHALPVLPPNEAADGFDIDAALAAVASLHQIAHDDESIPDEADLLVTAADDDSPADPLEINANALSDGLNPILETGILPVVTPEKESAPTFITDFVRPDLFTLERGQAASVIPAVLLMAAGAWLTYTLVSGAVVPAAQLIGLAGVGAGVMFLAHWLSSARFARGSFFVGWLLIGIGGWLMYLFQPSGSGFAGYPLALSIVGAALLLTAVLTQPRSGRLALIGLALVLAGGVGFGITQGIFDPAWLATIASAAPFIMGGVILVLVAPLLRRR